MQSENWSELQSRILFQIPGCSAGLLPRSVGKGLETEPGAIAFDSGFSCLSTFCFITRGGLAAKLLTLFPCFWIFIAFKRVSPCDTVTLQGSCAQITKWKCSTAGTEGTACATPTEGWCCLFWRLGCRKTGFAMCQLFAPWREINSGEYHTKNTKGVGAPRIRSLVQIPVLKQMRMNEVWGEKAVKYFIPDTTSTEDLQRS